MAIIDVHGMDNYSNIADLQAGSSLSLVPSGTLTIEDGAGKFGGKALRILNGYLRYPASTTASFGFHFKINSLSGAIEILRAHSSSNHISATINADGSMTLSRDRDNEQNTIVPAGTFVTDTWYYFCLSGLQSSPGYIKVRINNATYLWENIDTVYTGTAYWYLQSGSSFIDIDDLVFSNDGNYYLKNPHIIEHKVAVLDRAAQDFATFNGGAGYAEIDELVPDGDTSYIYATNPGDISEFEVSDPSVDMTEVYGIKLTSVASRDGTGGTNGLRVSLMTGENDTEVAYTAQALVDSTYTTEHSSVVTVNPDTAAEFTISEASNLYLKVEVV